MLDLAGTVIEPVTESVFVVVSVEPEVVVNPYDIERVIDTDADATPTLTPASTVIDIPIFNL